MNYEPGWDRERNFVEVLNRPGQARPGKDKNFTIEMKETEREAPWLCLRKGKYSLCNLKHNTALSSYIFIKIQQSKTTTRLRTEECEIVFSKENNIHIMSTRFPYTDN